MKKTSSKIKPDEGIGYHKTEKKSTNSKWDELVNQKKEPRVCRQSKRAPGRDESGVEKPGRETQKVKLSAKN